MDLVTGATGFLGGQLVNELLSQEKRVRILCRSEPTNASFDTSRVEVARGDLTDAASVEDATKDVERIFHVAGRVDFHPWRRKELLAVNEQGTRHVMSAAERAGVSRVVHVSSVSTIGATSDPTKPLNEEDFGTGEGLQLPYPQSKYRAEKVALEYASRGLPVVICNPTFFGGPGDKYLSSARTIVSFLKGQVWFGLTKGGMCYTDARDIVSGLVAAMEKGTPGERYILGGTNLALHEYHAILAKLTGHRAPRFRIPPWLAMGIAPLGRVYYGIQGKKIYVGVGDVRLASHCWHFDYTKAGRDLGLVCRSPEESLHDTVEWLKTEWKE
ncbi:3 beta-hydroxysteroid dehydrogenase/Delta 5--_4-isomerase [Planctomycetes bacterium Pan216]|uniref:3 beta-hydroxysteroid dehydrogenase/Delta 5-->4-isomerase n=1 Tax=Kolteria novifilia TaxID=2527975 RepID=A0A518BCA5_9BACT|nr:3 beta-hydroxysteroid dehydrogenase/Delta 5-->4-isomerase [Planctomycetes bacterium Pan216]